MKLRVSILAAMLALVAACDNSTDCGFANCDAIGGLPGGAGTGRVTVTADNAYALVRDAWYAALVSADVPFFVAATGVGDTSGGVAAAGVISKIGSGPGVHVDPFGPTVYNCPVSGTFTVTGDVADPDTLTAGDNVSYESSACDSGTGYTVDGMHTIDTDSVAGDVASGQFEVTQALNFTSFLAATPAVSVTMNGDHTATLDTTAVTSVTSLFSGNSLNVMENGVGITLTAFSGESTIDATAFVLDVRGTANGSGAAGSFDYSTTSRIVQLTGQNPSEGILNVYGDVGRARLAIVDETLVRVQVDENNSDNYEITVDMTWDEFLNGPGAVSWSDTDLD